VYAPVVYESIYGNTREVAEAVAEGPLEEGELERARAWGAELARELSVTSAR
jgi:flavorubredoxin